MKRVPVKSSQIAAVGYDKTEQMLEVEFSSGSLYRYRGVPDHVHTDMVLATSVSSYFHANVRGQYKTTRVIDGQEVDPSTARASDKSIDMLRRVAKKANLWGGTAWERMGPSWRGVAEACGHPYRDELVETWIGTMSQPQCSAAIDYCKTL